MGAWPYATDKASIVPRAERAWATLFEVLGSRLMVLRALDGLAEDDLTRPYRVYQPQDERTPPLDSGQPVARWVIGSVVDHVAEHLGYIQRLG